MKLLIDYCNSSQLNIYLFLGIGTVLFMTSKALDNSNSNTLELCMAGLGKIGSFLLLIVSVTALTFMGRNYAQQQFSDYKQTCRSRAVESLGGYKNIKGIKTSVKTITNDTDIDFLDIEKSSEQVKEIVVILSEEEFEMLASQR